MVRFDGEHGPRIIEQQREPARAVGQPHRGAHLRGLQTERCEHGRECRGVNAVAARRRRCERGERAVAADAHEADAALLNDLPRYPRNTAALHPGVATAERRVSGKRQLAARREDAHAVIGLIRCRSQQEGRIRQIRPARERLHPLVAQAVGVVNDGERVAAQCGAGEHVDLSEREASHRCSFKACASNAIPCSIRSALTVTNDRRSVLCFGWSA